MSALPANAVSSPWKRYLLPASACVALAACAAGIAVFLDRDDTHSEQAVAAISRRDVFGPGTLNGSAPGDSLNKPRAPAVLRPPRGLASSDGRQLLINPALHEVFDFFLLQQGGANADVDLRDYLEASLPHPACIQAMEIFEHYQAYMRAHDSLLSSQNFGDVGSAVPVPDIGRLVAWREQRDRMRLGMLGEQVVSVWYREDDNRFAEALEALRQRVGNAATAMASAKDGQGMNQAGEEELQEIVASEIKSFSARQQEQTLWAAHFQTYADAAARIRRESGPSPAEREGKIRELLESLFATEADRQRARDLGP